MPFIRNKGADRKKAVARVERREHTGKLRRGFHHHRGYWTDRGPLVTKKRTKKRKEKQLPVSNSANTREVTAGFFPAASNIQKAVYDKLRERRKGSSPRRMA